MNYEDKKPLPPSGEDAELDTSKVKRRPPFAGSAVFSAQFSPDPGTMKDVVVALGEREAQILIAGFRRYSADDPKVLRFTNVIRNVLLFCCLCDKVAPMDGSQLRLSLLTNKLRGLCRTDGSLDPEKLLIVYGETVNALSEAVSLTQLPPELLGLYVETQTAVEEECRALVKQAHLPSLPEKFTSAVAAAWDRLFKAAKSSILPGV